MAKGGNQKLKLIYLRDILLSRTDEDHGITINEIITELGRNDINAERKSIYDDIELLKRFGLDIEKRQEKHQTYYHVISRQFELPELKLLVDAVQSSKFITAKKSTELIHKLEGLSSKYNASKLQRQVYVTKRIKTMNECIYYNVDAIHTAIGSNTKIKFQYFQWTVDKEMKKKRNGEYYLVSPWALLWDDENYYLVAFDSEAQKIKHYRVDKMLKIDQTEEQREGKEFFKEFDGGDYSKKMFGMYGGEEMEVRIQFKNEFAGVVIDRFGKEIIMRKTDSEHFQVHITVVVSDQFLAWLIGLGDGAKLLGPDVACDKLRCMIKTLNKIYMDK